jgi:putative phosphoribosyl transferase
MRFTDPRSAGLALAAKLEAYGGREATVVLALARGGVAVGLEVSKHLGLPLDLILLRRLLVPRGPDSPVCASSVGGTLFVDEELDEELAACNEPALAHFVADALAELDARVRACRGDRPPFELKRKTVLLVDNGIRTGSTMRAAIRAVRSGGPARIVAAVPVSAAEARAGVEAVVEDFIYLASPEPFGHVGLWYRDFRRPGDDEIRAMLEESDQSTNAVRDPHLP